MKRRRVDDLHVILVKVYPLTHLRGSALILKPGAKEGVCRNISVGSAVNTEIITTTLDCSVTRERERTPKKKVKY